MKVEVALHKILKIILFPCNFSKGFAPDEMLD